MASGSNVIEVDGDYFGMATGGHVGSGSNSSTFDHAPGDTTNLVITGYPDDSAPYVFEVGDRFDLSWDSPSGGGLLTGATVVRSDAVDPATTGCEGFAVVFEGRDDNGNIVQVLWSPDVNVSDWYWANYSSYAPPSFYNTDQDPATRYQMVCFEAATRVATPGGPRPVGGLAPGDLVTTVDAGPMPLRWVARQRRPGIGADMPLRFAPGVLGNSAPLVVSPQHRVLLAGPLVELFTGAAEMLVPAKALASRPGVRREMRAGVVYVNLLFDSHALVLAEGAEVESLLYGPVAEAALTGASVAGDAVARRLLGRKPGYQRAVRPVLSLRDAVALVALLGTGPLVVGTPRARAGPLRAAV
ncbi:Hint domain-containing protein [Sinisalibacter aestuarii]|uniref:Hedgehog/Intein (Hint) domain-containing protein n=1 Tax=Sinisalibacter aestuarii TaxID=2949426 RepID=A0ABQ5LQ78_9RHOB|nr:Hint domain-containing protein [Sinisalibacter aestuarii]GKY87136.1 hypothetical protein STA1M1_10050 [Sinisalibacter aestuarii]